MSIRASYWVTGGILAVLGLAVGKAILAFLAGIVVAVGAVLVKAVVIIALVAAIWLVVRAARGRRGEASA